MAPTPHHLTLLSSCLPVIVCLTSLATLGLAQTNPSVFLSNSSIVSYEGDWTFVPAALDVPLPPTMKTNSFSATATWVFFGESCSTSVATSYEYLSEILVGSSLQILSNFTLDAATGTLLIDNVESVSPPNDDDEFILLLANVTFVNASLPHTVVLSKSTLSSNDSFLSVMDFL